MSELGTILDPRSLPATLNFYGASDFATMEPKKGKREPDRTEHGVIGLDCIGDMWFVDWWFGQKETDVGIEKFIQLAKRWKPRAWWNEGGSIDKAIGPAIRKRMRETNTYVNIKELPMLADKGIKLQSFHARTTARTVHFPINAPWADHVMEQLVKFPAGRWDDAADVCGLLGRGIDEMFDARPKVVTSRPELVPYTAKWLETSRFPTTPTVRYF